MNKRLIGIVGGVALMGATLAGCGMYEIDRNAVNAVKVEGTANLWRFCDGPTLVYYQDFDGAEDEIVAMFWGACTEQADIKAPKDGDVVEGSTNNG